MTAHQPLVGLAVAAAERLEQLLFAGFLRREGTRTLSDLLQSSS